MITSSEHHYPALCVEVGVNCEACTGASARELAKACPDLPLRSVVHLFAQIHVYPACSRMHLNFAKAYKEASSVPERRPVQAEGLLAAVAVA